MKYKIGRNRAHFLHGCGLSDVKCNRCPESMLFVPIAQCPVSQVAGGVHTNLVDEHFKSLLTTGLLHIVRLREISDNGLPVMKQRYRAHPDIGVKCCRSLIFCHRLDIDIANHCRRDLDVIPGHCHHIVHELLRRCRRLTSSCQHQFVAAL